MATSPFSGHTLASPDATQGRGAPQGVIHDPYGRPIPPRTDDPAWQPPSDPLKGPAAAIGIIHREIPLSTVQTSWTVPDTRRAIQDLVAGRFDSASQLIDSIVGDSRVQASMASRTGGLLGRPVKFTIPQKYRDSAAAKECLDAWQEIWPTLGSEAVLSELQQWAVHLGFGVGQLMWDQSGDYDVPHLRPWHPRYTYYDFLGWRYIAVTQDSQVPIVAGNGTWVLHAPHGGYRGWMRGAMRSIAPWWLGRNYALRDWMRYSEKHGMPLVLAKTPVVGENDPAIQQFRAAMATLGQESVVQLPQGVDGNYSYNLEYLEASDQSWQTFQQIISICNTEITLALLAQNLTTEVKEGSYAAARVHGDVRQSLLEADARALSATIYNQIARPFAFANFGNADLAPRTDWDVTPAEDYDVTSKTLLAFAQSVFELRRAGFQIQNVEDLARTYGIKLSLAQIEAVDPLVGGAGGGAGAIGGSGFGAGGGK